MIEEDFEVKDQEPKIIKKKIRNLHLSYDPSLLHFETKKRNDLHIELMIN